MDSGNYTLVLNTTHFHLGILYHRFLKEMKYFLKLISTKNQLDKNLKLDKGIHFLQLMKKTLQRL